MIVKNNIDESQADNSSSGNLEHKYLPVENHAVLFLSFTNCVMLDFSWQPRLSYLNN